MENIIINSAELKKLATASKFISCDDLRPAIMHICIHFRNNIMTIFSTNGQYLFYTKGADCTQENKLEILISKETAIAISKLSPSFNTTELSILPKNKIMIEGNVFDYYSKEMFPDVFRIIPSYNKFIEFNKNDFVSNLKKLLPFTNKKTKQVNINFNDNISFSPNVEDTNQPELEMKYLSKDFTDTEVTFDGKMLIEVLTSLKSKNIKMYSNGSNTNCFLFTNGIETLLLMPIMRFNYTKNY